mmetsp:Transcript_93223/g.263550  ORF Transcript_93223/g.263550 Transcript_93223/m.263550 type:complete len:252 (+) Transcript_93223:803-1558(+)
MAHAFSGAKSASVYWCRKGAWLGSQLCSIQTRQPAGASLRPQFGLSGRSSSMKGSAASASSALASWGQTKSRPLTTLVGYEGSRVLRAPSSNRSASSSPAAMGTFAQLPSPLKHQPWKRHMSRPSSVTRPFDRGARRWLQTPPVHLHVSSPSFQTTSSLPRSLMGSGPLSTSIASGITGYHCFAQSYTGFTGCFSSAGAGVVAALGPLDAAPSAGFLPTGGSSRTVDPAGPALAVAARRHAATARRAEPRR